MGYLGGLILNAVPLKSSHFWLCLCPLPWAARPDAELNPKYLWLRDLMTPPKRGKRFLERSNNELEET